MLGLIRLLCLMLALICIWPLNLHAKREVDRQLDQALQQFVGTYQADQGRVVSVAYDDRGFKIDEAVSSFPPFVSARLVYDFPQRLLVEKDGGLIYELRQGRFFKKQTSTLELEVTGPSELTVRVTKAQLSEKTVQVTRLILNGKTLTYRREQRNYRRSHRWLGLWIEVPDSDGTQAVTASYERLTYRSLEAADLMRMAYTGQRSLLTEEVETSPPPTAVILKFSPQRCRPFPRVDTTE